MPGPFPLNSLAPTVTAAGITAPPYADILTSLQTSAAAIFGQDVSLDADDADGQMLAIYALAQNDVNNAVISGYQNFSPFSATGVGLSSIVKINGLRRQNATNSTADLTIIGQAGTIIAGGIVFDAASNQWALPTVVTIPFSGQTVALATCQTAGSVQAGPDTIGFGTAGTASYPLNPIPGWQSASNPAAAIVGQPVEIDAQLRIRQSTSVALAATGPIDAIEAALGQVAGVSRLRVFMNTNDAPDVNGIPGHSIAAVVAGGDPTAIATAISRKVLGCGTYGTTSVVVYDSAGMPNTIAFFALATVPVYGAITIQAKAGYVSTTGNLIIGAIVAALNDLDIGETVYLDDFNAPAKLTGEAATGSSGLSQAQLDVLSKTYVVRSITFGRSATTLGVSDMVISFYQAVSAAVANFTLTVLSS